MNFIQYLAPHQPEICIPFVYKDITDTDIINTFISLNIANNISINSKITTNKLGNTGRTVYLQFQKWNRNFNADKLRIQLVNGLHADIQYKPNAFWKIYANNYNKNNINNNRNYHDDNRNNRNYHDDNRNNRNYHDDNRNNRNNRNYDDNRINKNNRNHHDDNRINKNNRNHHDDNRNNKNRYDNKQKSYSKPDTPTQQPQQTHYRPHTPDVPPPTQTPQQTPDTEPIVAFCGDDTNDRITNNFTDFDDTQEKIKVEYDMSNFKRPKKITTKHSNQTAVIKKVKQIIETQQQQQE